MDHLEAHRASFTGIIYQGLAVCGNVSGHTYHYCAAADNVGAPHLGMGHPTGVPADLPELFRDRLGDDLELYPILSYGDTTDVTLLDALFASEPLAEAFAADALAYAAAHGLQGLNFDIEPTATGTFWEDAPKFLGVVEAAFAAAGKRVTWDSNGPEGRAYPVDEWIAMTTYGYDTGDGYQLEAVRGLTAVGPDRFGFGMCPTCTLHNASDVAGRFAYLAKPPGSLAREIDLWATYGGAGDAYFDNWADYWAPLAAWLQA